ncbi:MAG: sulfatase [Planctomycetota bacterium]
MLGVSRKILAALLSLAPISHAAGSDDPRPNVVLIVCDDLNDWIEPLGGHPQARTPALAAFARTAVNFSNAHSNNPVCAPSRASMLTGIYPHTSGNLFWSEWHKNPVLAGSKTVMAHFRDNGYRVVGSGKLMHHFRRGEWDEFPNRADYGPIAWDGEQRVGHPSVAEPFRSIGPIDGSFGSLDDVPFGGENGAGWIYGGWGETRPFRYDGPESRSLTPDEKAARWAARRLERFAEQDGGPFFLAVGFIRPHTPMYAPKEFFDLFPLDKVRTTERLPGDIEDTRYQRHFKPDQKGLRYFRAIAESYGSEEAGLRGFTRAYLACVSFVDAQIGVVLEALERAGLEENTIVVITSDHGFGMGEKSYLFKNAPWEESTRVPLLIRVPGVSQQGAEASVPVGLIDIYPTLADLCALDGDTRKNEAGRPLDGRSLRPLLEDPAAGRWDGPPAALTMLHAGEAATRALSAEDENRAARQHWSIRTERYRYVRYNSGAIELYDHADDPNEWHNLAGEPAHAPAVARLDALLREMIRPIELAPIGGPRPRE